MSLEFIKLLSISIYNIIFKWKKYKFNSILMNIIYYKQGQIRAATTKKLKKINFPLT